MFMCSLSFESALMHHIRYCDNDDCTRKRTCICGQTKDAWEQNFLGIPFHNLPVATAVLSTTIRRESINILLQNKRKLLCGFQFIPLFVKRGFKSLREVCALGVTGV